MHTTSVCDCNCNKTKGMKDGVVSIAARVNAEVHTITELSMAFTVRVTLKIERLAGLQEGQLTCTNNRIHM